MISVIIPVYNVEKFLPRSIESIINQTYKDLEIILVNDGSLDLSGNICDQYAKSDSRIKVIHQKNQGTSAARNRGLDIAQGEYIGFIDPDDFVSINFYEILLNKLIDTNSDLSFCLFNEFHEENIVTDNNLVDYKSINVKVDCGYRLIKNFSYKGNTVHYVVIWNKLYKKCLWDNLRFPLDSKICEDEYVWYKCIFNSKKVCEIELKLYNYYIRENSTMNQNYGDYTYKKEIAFLKALNDRIDFSKKNKLNKFLKRTQIYRNKILRKIYITTPKANLPNYIETELLKNTKHIPFIKRIKIYIKQRSLN